MELQYVFDSDHEFKQLLREAFAATQDLTIPLKLIAREWYQSNKSIFKLKSEGRYQDLNFRYKKIKLSEVGFIYPILKKSGRLARSITNPADDEAINTIINRRELILGTSVPYAIFHQSAQPRRIIPYRPFLFVGVEQIAPNDIKQNRLKNWMKIIESHYMQILNRKNKG